jgi:hypothetical protein
MDINRFNLLVKAMNTNKARERLIDMENILYGSRMKADAQKKLHRKIYNVAIPPELKAKKAVTTEQLGNIYGMGSVEDILKGNK